VLRKIQQYRDAIAACFQANDSPLTMRQILAWIDGAYPNNDFSKSTLTSQVYKSCANVSYAQGSSAPKILFFNRGTNTYQRADGTQAADAEHSVAITDTAVDRNVLAPIPRFSLEADLQASLVHDLSALEEGLALWSMQPPSVEYTFDTKRRVDILAKDRNGIPVIVELKRGEAYDKVVGQALLYRGLLKAKLSVDRIRIFLVASIMTDEIKTACSTVEDVELFEYSISIKTQRVNSSWIEE
jgi:hypothetical protein